jgi:hypothetical protein
MRILMVMTMMTCPRVRRGPGLVDGEGQATHLRDMVLESEASSPPHPSTSAGEGEADVTCAGCEPHSVDTSGKIRVRGKEREL